MATPPGSEDVGQAGKTSQPNPVAGDLDMTQVRNSFPALRGDEVFLDNAGGSQTLGTVIDSIRDYLTNTNVQLGATYGTSKKSTALYNAGYAAASGYINAYANEIVLGPSTTALLRIFSFTVDFSPGDEIVVSALDHEANIAPWVDLAARQHLVLKWWPPPPPSGTPTTNPKLTPENLAPLLSARTRLVAFTHASNILGTVHDVLELAAAANRAAPDALVAVDGVAYAPHRPLDVRALGVDLYAFSWYKTYGPHVAQLYASPRARSRMRSLGHFFNQHVTLENKMALAASSYELVAALPSAVEYLGGQWEAIARHEAELQGLLLGFLNARDDVTVYGETSADGAVRVPTVSFTVKGWDSKELVESVEKEYLGLSQNGVVRISMVHYNTVDEIQSLIGVLEKVLSEGR